MMYSKGFRLAGPLGTIRPDPFSGTVAVTVRPDEKQEFLIFPNKSVKMLFEDNTSNPKSRICVDGYSVRADRTGLWSCKHILNQGWRQFATGMSLKATESLWVDRFGAVKYSGQKILTFKFDKMVG